MSSAPLSADAERLKNQGNECFKEQRFHKAIDFYTKALDAQLHPILLSNRAQSYLKVHRPQEAYVDADEALRLDPQNLKALYRRAQALLKLGLKSKACNDFRRCAQLDPNNRDAKSQVEALNDAKDAGIVDVYCFHKDEPIQSPTPLQTMRLAATHRYDQPPPPPVVRLENPFDDELAAASRPGPSATSIEPAAEEDFADHISRLSVHVLDDNELKSSALSDEDLGWADMPPAAETFIEFLTAWMELRDDPTRFAAYFLTLNLDAFGQIFDEMADLDVLPTLIRGLHDYSQWSTSAMRRALQTLRRLAATARFELCIALLDGTVADELSSFLARAESVTEAELVADVRQLYQLAS